MNKDPRKKAFTSPALGKKTKPYTQVEILFVLWDKYSENYKKGHCIRREEKKNALIYHNHSKLNKMIYHIEIEIVVN